MRAFGSVARWGFGNYARLFADPHFATAVRNNCSTPPAPSFQAWHWRCCSRWACVRRRASTSTLRTLFVLPLLIPLVAAASLFIFIFLPGAGLLDYYLAKFGLAETNWFGNPSLALGSIIAITVWKNTGYYMLFFSPAWPACRRISWTRQRSTAPTRCSASSTSRCRCSVPTLAFVLVIAC